jgi:hypothetical protein
MPNVKPEFEIDNTFVQLAHQIVDKYPEAFDGIEVDKIRCAKITNKERPNASDQLWKLQAVKMPVRLDCPFAWYITLFSSDWDKLENKSKLLLVAQILFAIPTDADNEGKVNTFDSKDFAVMQRTFKTIDYLREPNMPHIIDEEINWVTSYHTDIKQEEENEDND